ncbi:hypothetical protein E3Q13_03804, partial [Wallemia mellicola]
NIPSKQFEANRPTILPPINLPPIQGSDRPHLPPIGGSQQSRDLPRPFSAPSNKMGVQAILSESSYQPPQPAAQSTAYSYSQPSNYYQNEQNYSQRPYTQSNITPTWSPSPLTSATANNPVQPTDSPAYANQQPYPYPHSQIYQQTQYEQQVQQQPQQSQQFTAPRSRPEFGSMDEVVARQQAHISKSQAQENNSRSIVSKRKREQVIQQEEPLYQEPLYPQRQQYVREPVYDYEEDEDDYRPTRQRQPVVEERPPAKVKSSSDREKEALFVYKDLDVYDAQGSLKVTSDSVYEALSKSPRFSIGSHVYQPDSLVDFYPHQVGGVFEMYVPGAWLGDNWAVRELLPQKNGDSVELTPKVRHVKGKTSRLALTDLDALDERRIWGTDVYTDDSDPVAIAVHLGWLFDASDKSYDRRLLVGAGRPAEGEKVDDVIEDADLVLVFRVAPRLVAYHSSMRHRLWSRGWGNQHDGFSLVLEECRLVPKEKDNVVRPSKQLRKARIALIAEARKTIMDSPSLKVKEGDIDYNAADENDVWKLLSEDHKTNEKVKFNKGGIKMIKRGDRRFKRVEKDESEKELEALLAIQQERELLEAQARAEEEEKSKAEETERKAREEEKRVAEEAQAAQEKEKNELLQAGEPQPMEEPPAESEQPTRQEQEQQTQDVRASLQNDELPQLEHQLEHDETNQNEVSQQEQSAQQEMSVEHVEPRLQDQPTKEEERIQHEHQVQQEEESLQEKPLVQEQSLQSEQQIPSQSNQPKVQSDQVGPEQMQSVEQMQSSHENQSEQQLEQPIKQEAHDPVQSEAVTEDVPAPVSSSAPTAPQEIQHVSMDIDRSAPVEPIQEETKTFSVEEASTQQEQPQTFTISQGPVYEPVEPVALSEPSAAQPESDVSEIKFVNHDTVEAPNQEVSASQAAPQGDALTMQIAQAKQALEANESSASRTDNTLDPGRTETNYEASNQQPVANEQNYFNVATSQVPQSSNSQSQVQLNEDTTSINAPPTTNVKETEMNPPSN